MSSRPPLLLLHGALGAAEQFAPLLPLCQAQWEVHTLSFEGHGPAPAIAPDRPFRIEHFAENVLAYLDAHHLPAAHFFGYSMGGYVALWLAHTHPTRVQSVQTLGTKLVWSPETAARETRLLDAAKIRAKVPQFAQELERRHTALGWETVLARTADLLTDLGQHPRLTPETWAQLTVRVRLGVGDRDNTVTLEETLAAYRALPNAELAVWPNTPHPLDKIAPAQWATQLAPPTWATP